MHLSPASCRKFFRLIDALSLYAKKRLSLPSFPGDIYSFKSPLLCDEFRYEISRTLWNRPDIIDDFVRENPYGLDDAALAEILSWKAARPRTYILWKHEGGRSLFMGEEGTFSVMGLSRDIREAIPSTPAIVQTTLLPFEDAIVYGVTIMQYPVEMLGGALKMQQELFEKEKAKGIVSSSQEFIRLSREFNERKATEEFEEFWEDISRQNDVANGREVLPAGMHRGILAGLSEEERERKIRERMQEISNSRNVVRAILEDSAVRKKPVSSLRDHLMLETKDRLIGIARAYGTKGLTSLRKEQVADAVAKAILANPDYAKRSLAYCNKTLFNSVRGSIEADGDIVAPVGKAIERGGELIPFPPYNQLFMHGDSLTLCMPNEIRDMLGGIGWSKLEDLRKRVDDITHCAQVCVDFYGLMNLRDFSRLIEEWYGYSFDRMELFKEIMATTTWEERGYDLWVSGLDIYLISHHLSEGNLPPGYPNEDETRGVLEEYREYLVERHDETPMRDLDPVLKETDAFEWKMRLPSTLRLRNYLDAHVPDGEDDCFFAENVIEDLIMYSTGPADPSFMAEYLGDRGLLDDPKSANTVLALASGMMNGLPHWGNNGWSPQELFEKETGQKMFFNEDGSRVKVGRNDPCPCGSGKKYKKCCGR